VPFIDLLYVFVVEKNIAKIHSLVRLKLKGFPEVLVEQPPLTMARLGYSQKFEEEQPRRF